MQEYTQAIDRASFVVVSPSSLHISAAQFAKDLANEVHKRTETLVYCLKDIQNLISQQIKQHIQHSTKIYQLAMCIGYNEGEGGKGYHVFANDLQFDSYNGTFMDASRSGMVWDATKIQGRTETSTCGVAGGTGRIVWRTSAW